MSETSPITEQANPETELARDRCSPEDLPPDALQTIPRTEPVVQVLEQLNAQLENLYVGAGRTQVEEEEEEEEEEEDVVNDSGRLVKFDAGGSSSGGLKRIPSMTRGFPFPVSSLKPVGQAFENNRKMIWSWLMNDEISTIGICGMGGIGKTTILKHIHSELLQRPDISHHVYWVTLSQDFSIYRLQNLIAKHLDLDLSSEYDILPRAAKLSEELMKKQEWILIIEDVWESFELSTVGIPVPFKGCKVVFTTRSDAVCQRMDSQVIAEVTRLSEREAWTLFMETLGHGIALSPEVERIAGDIARECAGLPLGIITMAGSLRGVYEQDEWRNTLEKLKGSNSRDMEVEVFRVLRFSYDRLDDFKLQQCLKHCTLFPEDYIIEREGLIDYLIDKGIIQKLWSREATFDMGHAMLDRLENVRLLERIDGGRAVKMHDLIRDMVVCICEENPSVMEQRRKGIDIACSNAFGKICGLAPKQVLEVAFLTMFSSSYTHKTMGQRRKRIEMAPLKSGWTGAVSASEQEQNNVDMAQQREPLLTGEFERANDLTGARIELPPDTPDDDQDELKKLEGSKSRDMVDDFKSGLTGAVSASAREQNNFDKAQQREPLFTGEFERANDLTGARIELPPDSSDDQEPLFLALDSVHHVDRIVPPTIDENYNRREATERLVQPDVCSSAFVFYENHNAISTSQQENVAGDEETTPAAATRDHTPGRYFEEFSRWLMEDDEDEEPGEDKELLGPGRKRIEMAQLKSGWTLLLTSLILEIASAVFDQLGYALVGMVLAFVALLVATADLIHMAGKERMSLLPIFHRPSTPTFVPGKPVGTIVEYFGWVGAVWQCVYSTVAYAYARQNKDNPIKMSLLPLIFFSCVVISKLNERSSSTRVLRKGIFLTPKKPLYCG